MTHLPGALRAVSTQSSPLRLGCLALMASLTLLLTACGGGGGGGNPLPDPDPLPGFEIISGDGGCGGGGCGGDGGGSGGGGGGDGAGGGLGAMRNVIVTARRPDGTVLGSAALQGNLVSIYDRTYKGAFIVEFADNGSGNGEYYDEAAKDWTSLAGQTLHILVPRLTHHISANPLTEAAYQWAIAKYGSAAALTAARMTEANDTVLAAANARVPAAYQVSDITNYAEAVSDMTAANSLPNTNAGRYGTLLAGLPRAARIFSPGLPSPALAFAQQLVQDLVDDGVVNTSMPEVDQIAYGVELPALLADGIADARSEYGVAEQPVAAAEPNICFNPQAYFKVGATQSLSYQSTPVDGSPTTYSFETVVNGQRSFAGASDAIELQFTIDGGTFNNYFSPDLSNGLVSYGSSETFSGISYTSVYSPPFVSRQFQLRLGETETVTASGTFSYTDPSTGQTVDMPFSDTQTTSLVGFETVTVPAGTFTNACKYVVSTDSAGVVYTTTFWFTSSGQGVLVKSVDDSGAVDELLGGTVNGQPVR